jgi:hypothetical protein
MGLLRHEEENARLLTSYQPPDVVHDDLASLMMLGRPWLPVILPDNLGDPGRRHFLGLYADAP